MAYIVITTEDSVAPELVLAGKVKAALEAMQQDQHICAAFQYHWIELSGTRSEAHMSAIEARAQVGIEKVQTIIFVVLAPMDRKQSTQTTSTQYHVAHFPAQMP